MKNTNTATHEYVVPRTGEVPRNIELHSQEINALTQLGEVPAQVAAKAAGHTALEGAEMLRITQVNAEADRDLHLVLR